MRSGRRKRLPHRLWEDRELDFGAVGAAPVDALGGFDEVRRVGVGDLEEFLGVAVG